MKKYKVSLEFEIDVEANNTGEAKEKAFEAGIGNDITTIMDNMVVKEVE